MDQVTDGLWVSDIDTVATSSTDRFDVIISVCQDTVRENVSDECYYTQYPLADDVISKRRWGGTTEYETFDDVVWAVLIAQGLDAETLVHCHRGRNRSVATITAAVAVQRELRYPDAFQIVREARPIANPNALMRTHARRFINKNT